MSEKKEVKKTEWTTIKIPREVLYKLKALSYKEQKPYWKIVINAISFYDTIRRRPYIKSELPNIDKASWYIAKALMSIGSLKENPTKENLAKLEKTLNQIQKRIGINPEYVIASARSYVRKPDTDNRIELNASAKMLVIDILYKMVLKEVEEIRKME